MEWVPSCQFVDLYLNHEYAGLYLLIEKIEGSSGRLNLKPGTEIGKCEFLCRNEASIRFNAIDNPFWTKTERAIEISWPKDPTPSQKEQIANDVQLMENAILSSDETDILNYLDLESWVKKYLIDEISGNADADRNSSYFYCRYDPDGSPTFYSGPVWDYDASLGRESRCINPDSFVANTPWASKGEPRPYYYALYRNRLFFERATAVYQSEFLPLLEEFLHETIPSEAAAINEIGTMNRVRWFRHEETTDPMFLQEYLKKRVAFLNRVWIDREEICTVQIMRASRYETYTVEPGALLPDDLEILKNTNHTTPVWADLDTGERFDPQNPITKDTTLYIQETIEDIKLLGLVRTIYRYLKSHKMIALLLGVIGIGVIGLFGALLIRVCRKRKRKNGPSQ